MTKAKRKKKNSAKPRRKKPVKSLPTPWSFKGYPPEAVRPPQDWLQATLELSEATTNAALRDFSKQFLGLAKEYVGRDEAQAEGLIALVAELKAWVRDSQKKAHESAAWSKNYQKAYDDVVEKLINKEFEDKPAVEIANMIVKFIETGRKL